MAVSCMELYDLLKFVVNYLCVVKYACMIS